MNSLGLEFRCLLACKGVELTQAVEIKFVHGFVLPDRFVQLRLGEGWFIPFVVTQTTIAIQVDDCVLLELSAKLEGKAHDVSDGFGSSPFT